MGETPRTLPGSDFSRNHASECKEGLRGVYEKRWTRSEGKSILPSFSAPVVGWTVKLVEGGVG